MKKVLVVSFSMLVALSMLAPSVTHASFLDDLRAQLSALRVQLDELIKQSNALSETKITPTTPYSTSVVPGESLVVLQPTAQPKSTNGFITLEELPNNPQVSCTLPELLPREKSDAVNLLQIALYKAGYYKDGLITGYYGKLTEAAVKKFQSENGLSVTGRLDRVSASKLDGSVKEYFEECRTTKDIKQIFEIPTPPVIMPPHTTSTPYATTTPYDPPLPPIILPPVATSTATSTTSHPHGPAVWNYGWDDFTSPLGVDHSAQILENYRAHPEEYGVNPIGNNGYVPNPVLYGDSSPKMPTAVLRLYKACSDSWINRKEHIPVAPGGYANYRCTNRYQQQCFDDGSFDSYYDEACIYESPVSVEPTANQEFSYSASLLGAVKNELQYMASQLRTLVEKSR
ncbi:MAG: peptidoglycan-binding domain-containing protein [Candidatus Paceibacterota bacterium]|jgi:peptidoglycan hydrolase-like protein with peptidoglycan-binding domain